MKITAIEEYGLRVALQFARTGDGESLTIPEIAEAEGLSPTYVAKLLGLLRQHGVVTSERGRTGGYQLSRPASTVSVAEVLRVFGGPLLDAGHCERHSGVADICIHAGNCSVRSLWGALEGMIDRLLVAVSLADLAAGRFPAEELRAGSLEYATGRGRRASRESD